MKRTFFTIILTVMTSLTIISCTEDGIQPKKVDDLSCSPCDSGNGGGAGSTGEP